MDNLLKMQSQTEKIHVDYIELKTDIKNIYANFNEKYAVDLSEYESEMFNIKTPFKDLKSELSDLKDRLKKLGQLNLMAPEEFEEVKERENIVVERV